MILSTMMTMVLKPKFRIFVFTILIICLQGTVNADTFQPPTSVNKDIVLYSNIVVSNGCNSTLCNRTCPYRDDFPSYNDILKNKRDNCSSGDPAELPMNAYRHVVNTAVLYNSTSVCPPVNTTVTPSSQGYYSISLWVRAECRSSSRCFVLRYGGVTLAVGNDSMLELSTSTESKKVTFTYSKWIYTAIRCNGILGWFVDGKPIHIQSKGLMDSGVISLGPDEDLLADDHVFIADARYYGDVLTDREISAIYRGLKDLTNPSLQTECRCPADAPTLLSDTLCAVDSGSMPVRRVNHDGGYVEYLTDGDDSTYWKSNNNEPTAAVTISLQNVFQVVGISVVNFNPNFGDLVVNLDRDGQWIQDFAFRRNCVSNCYNVTKIDGELFELSEDSINDRDQDLYKYLADTVRLNLQSLTATQFSIGEIHIHVKCHCSGNDPSCVINGTDYTCNCGSNTSGTHCENCVGGYYREPGDFGCSFDCNCNQNGSVDNNCNQVGGDCACKPNVQNRTCDVCKFNTINLGSDDVNGCTSCDCNSTGIQYCADDGTCICKENVESLTGRCESCLPNHYGLGSDYGRCMPCECESKGTNSGELNQCDALTGQCDCKTNVQGRQCDQCKEGWYDFRSDSPTGCEKKCECSFVGSTRTDTCDVVTGNCDCLEPIENNRQCIPVIDRIIPTYGPIAGGTIITVSGLLLGNESTSRLEFRMNGLIQNVTFWNSSLITVETNVIATATNSRMSILWNNGSSTYRPLENDPIMFEYRPNPQLQINQKFYTYASGGCTLPVKGVNNMDSVYQPEIVLHVNNEDLLNGCDGPSSSTEIQCKTPSTQNYNITGNISFGFLFDGYRIYETLTDDIGELTVVKDPVVTVYSDTFGNVFDTEIKIEGEFPEIDRTCQNDMKVMVGDKECKVTSKSETTVICDPEETFPGSNREVELLVIFGNLHIRPGMIEFKDFWHTAGFLYIDLGVGCFLLIVIVLTIVICRVRRRTEKNQRSSMNIGLVEQRAVDNDYTAQPDSTSGFVNPVIAAIAPFQPDENPTKNPPGDPNKDSTKPFLDRLPTDIKKKVKASIIQRSSITLGNICTLKGSKIRIINGTFNSSSNQAGDIITVKTLISPYKENGEIPEWLTKGLLESIRLRDLLHENILESSGIAIDEKQVYFLYPETKRTLKDYLTGAAQPYPDSKKVDICVQVCEGMNYLDGNQIIHKDLAARNCWVNSNEVVKISDASFTPDLYPDEYLNLDGLHLPVRWMAPESLRQIGFYHSKSDVWSYGVVMWEVFTNGYLPYYDITNNTQITEFVCNQGYRLGKPHDCSDKIFAVIELCHVINSEDRPNFFLISNHLTEIISPTTPISYVNENSLENELDETVYQNVSAPQHQNVSAPQLPPRQRR